MRGELFDSTIPFGEPELLRASAYRRYLQELEADPTQSGLGSRLSQLSPSLRADLARFEQDGTGSEAVEVVAACVRHSKRVTIHLQCGERVVPLTVFPHEHLVHCPMDMDELIERHLSAVRVMHVEPALLRPPGDPVESLVGAAHLHHPLAPLMWHLALRGPRSELLPEIAGPAVYRVAPSLNINALPARGVLRSTIERLGRQSATLSDIATWPALDRERTARLLNGLYLQAGLIVSRSHPEAVRDTWF
jgi:hypothetical protein